MYEKAFRFQGEDNVSAMLGFTKLMLDEKYDKDAVLKQCKSILKRPIEMKEMSDMSQAFELAARAFEKENTYNEPKEEPSHIDLKINFLQMWSISTGCYVLSENESMGEQSLFLWQKIR